MNYWVLVLIVLLNVRIERKISSIIKMIASSKDTK